MATYEFFVLRRSDGRYGEINYYKGDSQEPVTPADTPEDTVLNIFGQHGYVLQSVQVQRNGDIKYYLQRQKT